MLKKVDPSHVVSIFLGCLMLSLVIFTVGNPSGASLWVLISAPFALFGWVAVCVLLFKLDRQWREGNEAIEAIKTRLLTQQAVDEQLHFFATNYQIVCRRKLDQTTRSMEVALETRRAELEVLNRVFIEAHTIARQLGFNLKGGLQDYLSLEDKLSDKST